MQLLVLDPVHASRLAAFLTTLGRPASVTAPDRVDVEETADETQRLEVELYLRVWQVLYPDAEVELAAEERP
jgi:hypothetical protein